MTTRLIGVVFFSMLLAMPVFADDYCAGCPGEIKKKCESPGWCGSECGLVYCGIANAGCSVAYYDGRTCHETSHFKADLRLFGTPQEPNPGDQEKVTITMSKREWKNLLTEIERLSRK